MQVTDVIKTFLPSRSVGRYKSVNIWIMNFMCIQHRFKALYKVIFFR